MTISYALTVCNEHREIDKLLSILTEAIREEDEIVVQCDQDNTTAEVIWALEYYADLINVIEYPLNNDFASFKNNLKENCTKDFIFQIDADEFLHKELCQYLPPILDSNPTVDLYRVPRINTVEGITQEHIQKWGWRYEDGRVNFPDYQTRIIRNKPGIEWKNKVHEVITGHKEEAFLPTNDLFCLMHPKTIERQEIQNKLYEQI